MKTIDNYKAQQAQTVTLLTRLVKFLAAGEKFGIVPDQSVIDKLQNGIDKAAHDKLKVALVGGFSEGKTSIAAAWSEKYEKSMMKISQSESTDDVLVYELEDIELVDTPGLFGFKETDDKKKYKDITKQYVSEANLVLYVMNPNNPIKESHKEDLVWLFKDLDLLSRTVFVVSRFDEEVDIEDQAEFQQGFAIKRANIVQRLQDFGIVNADQDLSIVAVSANPFGEGIPYWLENMTEYKTISHIDDLQQATADKIQQAGGANAIVLASQDSIIKDVLMNEIPKAEQRVSKAAVEINNFKEACEDIQSQLDKSDRTISNVKIDLRTFIDNLFKSLIMQVKGTDSETINDFFERNIGADGIVLETKIQNEFESQLGKMVSEIGKVEMSFESSVTHYNSIIGGMAFEGLKQGGEFLKKGGFKLSGSNVLAARDIIMPTMKFKPWGALKFAENATKGLTYFGAALGVGLDILDEYQAVQAQKAFETEVEDTVGKLEKQRREYLTLINDQQKFVDQFFPSYVELAKQVADMHEQVTERESFQRDFENWKHDGDIIEADFEVVG